VNPGTHRRLGVDERRAQRIEFGTELFSEQELRQTMTALLAAA
jgi:hypothetical protein